MPELNKKLDHFTATILAEATAETERALAELKEKHNSSYSAAEDRVLGETYHYIRTEVARIKSDAGRRISRHMLDDKRALYLRREEIAREVFGEVRDKIIAYTAGAAYPERLKVLCRRTADALNGADDIRVYLRAADRKLADALSAAVPGVKLQFLEGSFVLGGLVAESPSLGRRVDATFDSAMEELDGHFAELFGLSLSDNLTEE